MAQRAEPADSFDFFPTPPWATRALCEYALGGWELDRMTVWEPACGQGHMARPLAEYFAGVHASDVQNFGFGDVEDFLLPFPRVASHWIITNPPFRLAEQFAAKAIEAATFGVALLVRSTFLEGVGRHERLFSAHPPHSIHQFVERVPMHKGRLDKDGSTATAYSWIVWRRGWPTIGESRPTEFCWIPQCRRELERPEDYLFANAGR